MHTAPMLTVEKRWGRWQVTHTPTGARVNGCRFQSADKAKAAVKMLMQLPVEWNHASLDYYQQHKPLLTKEIDRWKKANK